MPPQRFLPDVGRGHRVAGGILIVIFGLPLAWLVSWAIAVGHVNGTAIVFFLVFGGLVALGGRFAFWPSEYLEIDLEARTFNVIRSGKRGAAAALNALGPLEVRKHTRVVSTKNGTRTITDYVVRAAVHSDIDLYAMKTPGKARQKMEELARAWHLPCQSLGGAVRQADALDTPLHERLRGDDAARKPRPLSPGWSVRVEPAPMGYAMVSTHRTYTPLYAPAAFLIVALYSLHGLLTDDSLLNQLTDGARNGDPMAMVLTGLLGIGALVLLRLLWVGVRDTFFPGTVTINDRGVTYRGRTMRFKHIEEVTATSCVEIVGDARILGLAETFCPLAAGDAVAHELQRLIIEVAASHDA